MSPNILFPNLPLQDMFSEPVLEMEHLDPCYADHSTDVWRVRTARRTVALRLFNAGEWGGPFWGGMRCLFHWQHAFRGKVSARNRFLRQAGGLPVPRVLSQGVWNYLEYLVMEWMPGRRMASFSELGLKGLHAFGRHLAALHSHSFPKNGTLDGGKGWPAAQFSIELVGALNMLYQNFYQDQQEFSDMHEAMLQCARQVEVKSFAPVLVDLGAAQYLCSEQGEICALIDTDAYAIGPRELDFILLEYGLNSVQAKEFAKGYQDLLPLPDLRPVRQVYRYLYRMMEVEGDVPLNEWMSQKEIFDNE